MEETSHLRSRAADRRVTHPETLLVTFLLDELQRARGRIATLEALLAAREAAPVAEVAQLADVAQLAEVADHRVAA